MKEDKGQNECQLSINPLSQLLATLSDKYGVSFEYVGYIYIFNPNYYSNAKQITTNLAAPIIKMIYSALWPKTEGCHQF